MKKKIVIAIDGPVGSGKGTLALALSKRLGMQYLYTGAMYRALAYSSLKENINFNNEKKVLNLLNKISIKLEVHESGTSVFLDGQEISDEIFLPETARVVPIVSAFSSVRKEMVTRQKAMIDEVSTIIEGRDSATVVAPNADLKIYVTADVNERARRRFNQFKEKGIEVTFEDVITDLKERDKKDMQRKASPLTIVKDSYILDTTNLTIDQTVDKVTEKLKEKKLI